MIVTLQMGDKTETGVLLCYDDPEFEEEEQEFPFMRWNRYLYQTKDEYFLDKMTVVVISTETPEVMHGLLHVKVLGDHIERNFLKNGETRMIVDFVTRLNESIERQFECQGVIANIPIWNGREVVLRRSSGLDHENKISGKCFAEEWIGNLCISLFHVTKTFSTLCPNEFTHRKCSQEGKVTSSLKSPRCSDQLFWLWWPVTKPRNLKSFLEELRKKESIDTKFFKVHMLPSGIYRVGIIKQEKEERWLMKVHASRQLNIPIYFEEPHKSGHQCEYEPDYSEETRIIFNCNFALNSGSQRGANTYGIFGSFAYVTAQLFPYLEDNNCPSLPCFSPWRSLMEFKTLVSQHKLRVEQMQKVVRRARRLQSQLQEERTQLGFE